MKNPAIAAKGLKFNGKGLIPAVIQDYRTKKVLMVAWMNAEAVKRTFKDKRAWFYSRSRKKMWLKGETSGNIQQVKEIYTDCDKDCLLVTVKQIGNAACHEGYNSCFYRKFDKKNELKVIEKRVFDPKKVYK